MTTQTTSTANTKYVDKLISHVEYSRLEASRVLNRGRRATLGQFFTPFDTGRLMASMFRWQRDGEIRLLDAGAGVGSLTAALVVDICGRALRPQQLRVTAYEVDPALQAYLQETLDLCGAACTGADIDFTGRVVREDFVSSAAGMLEGGFFNPPLTSFNAAILNPPYHKIHSASETRTLLRRIGIETSNIYTGFLFTALRLLEIEGQLVAITPRSFFNGVYFKTFRKWLLQNLSLEKIHTFERRDQAFKDDDVLQENVIFHGIKAIPAPTIVQVCSSVGAHDSHVACRAVPYSQVVHPHDPESFIRLVPDELGHSVTERITSLRSSLRELGLSVSTGRVVDFRAKALLRQSPTRNSVPLIYPVHLRNGAVHWPSHKGKKPNAISGEPAADDLLVPSAPYALVKRFSAKEEKKRVVAAVFDPDSVQSERIGLENHLNYFHDHGRGLPLTLARGITAYLNSTMFDVYFRQFNGHTQVNATDLRNVPFPTRDQLEALGAKIGVAFPSQAELDKLIEEELFANFQR